MQSSQSQGMTSLSGTAPQVSTQTSQTPTTSGRTLKELHESVQAQNQELASLRKSLNNPPKRRVVERIAAKVEDRPFRPEGPADSDVAICLRHAIDTQGAMGLALVAQGFAQRYQQDNDIQPRANYDEIASDGNRIHFTLILLTMEEEFLKHLVRGDLLWEYFHNPTFMASVKAHHQLTLHPGTYIQILGRQEIVHEIPNPPEPNPDAGGWLTPRELWQVWSIAVRYQPGFTGPDQSRLAKDIDDQLPGWPTKPQSWYRSGGPNQPGGRRYAGNDSLQRKIRKWLSVWREMYIVRIKKLIDDEKSSGTKNPVLDAPMQSCPVGIGWGSHVLARAGQHDTHSINSNPLWSFFLAIVKFQLDPDHKKFAVFRFQTNRLSDPDRAYEDARLSDTGITLIARSEWHQGGFNITPGGGAGVREKPILDAMDWIQSNYAAIYTESSIFVSNCDSMRATMAKLDQQRQNLANAPAIRKRLEDEREEQKRTVEELQKDVDKMNKVIRLKRVREAIRKLGLQRHFGDSRGAITKFFGGNCSGS